MPRPPTSGYERLAQHAELSDSDSEDESHSRIAPIRLPSDSRLSRRDIASPQSYYGDGRTPERRGGSGVDIKAINARLERWAEEIASKFKIGKNKGRATHDDSPLEIVYSVFVAPEGYRQITDLGTMEPNEHGHLTKSQFDLIVDSVRRAINAGIDPTLIKQGSSGSYFMRNRDGKVVGVMKPKDEEPYGHLNPKTTKWLHRNLFPCFFGRSCLIPNLSYISEAAACLLDRQLRTFLVPHTELVWLSTKAFHYDYWDRRAFYRGKKPLPPKVGSFQAFLQGYEDANIFLRKHPWPDATTTGLRSDAASRKRTRWGNTCRPGGSVDDDDEDLEAQSNSPHNDPTSRKFAWTETVQQQFREELEKLVILDYIMRNTDRGLDNWMVKIEWKPTSTSTGRGKSVSGNGMIPQHVLDDMSSSAPRPDSPGYQRHEPMSASSRSATPIGGYTPVLKIGAIDNSLAFPWKHPDQWRSFPFGWLFLPVSLIGQPFSAKTRDHFLPLLTSTKWWTETQSLLRGLFEQDADFKERMFAKQMAVLKGQAFNVVETLKSPDQGPLELTRRTRVHVWDDEMEVPIAVPLRVPSMESRRRAEYHDDILHEEVDIGAAATSAPLPRSQDMLGLGLSPPSDIPSAGRFHIGRSASNQGESNSAQQQPEDVDISVLSGSPPSTMRSTYSEDLARPLPEPRRPRMSYERKQSASSILGQAGRRRGGSLSTVLFGGDDVEGDLGYAAAEDMENSTRKVIVERLETVKTSNPVFSWC